MNKVTILLIDDHQLITDAWSFLLSNDERFAVVGNASDSVTALEKAAQLHPDIVLCDINIGPDNGITITKSIKQINPEIKIIGVSVHSNPVYVKKIMEAGARGYVTKNSSVEELKEAITTVHKGMNYICKEVQALVAGSFMEEQTDNYHRLTARELEIIKMLTEGMSSKEIGLKLGISMKTVEIHRYHILKKLNMKNTAALITYANQRGI